MTKKILLIYSLFSCMTIGLIFGFGYIFSIALNTLLFLSCIIFFAFNFLGLAFHYSLSLIIEYLEDLLASIKIEAIPATLPTSEPVFEIIGNEEEL
jgi:hypothetical protein